MALVDFTTCDDIRASLGVSEDEIEDATILLPLQEDNLVVELEDISLTLIADFTTTKALSTPTDVQTRFLRACRLFATYAVAKQLTSSLPLFSPKEISDGKASMVRYAQSPYKDTIAEVKRQYEAFKTRLAAAYAALQSSSVAATPLRTTFVVSSPSYDPITGV